MQRVNSPRPSATRGVTAIEFAIVLPILLLFTFGLIDLGRALWTEGTLTYAAQVTARCAAIGSCANPVAYAQDHAYGLNPTRVIVRATTPDPACGKEFTLATAFTYYMPLLSNFSGMFSATACYPTS